MKDMVGIELAPGQGVLKLQKNALIPGITKKVGKSKLVISSFNCSYDHDTKVFTPIPTHIPIRNSDRLIVFQFTPASIRHILDNPNCFSELTTATKLKLLEQFLILAKELGVEKITDMALELEIANTPDYLDLEI